MSRRRFTYEQVSAILADKTPPAPGEVEPEVYDLLLGMRDLAMILRKRRRKRGRLN